MKRDIALSGILGLIVGLLIVFFANWLKGFIPTPVSDSITTLVVFSIILLIALLEMPLMVFAIRRMSGTIMPRRIIGGVFLFYVSFAAVYAAIFLLLTADSYSNLGMVLFASSTIRFLTGIFIK